MSNQQSSTAELSGRARPEWQHGGVTIPYPHAGDSAGRETFVQAMGHAVTGVNVVTTDGPSGRFGLTVSAMASLSADPPMVLVCINRRSPLNRALHENGQFCVNVLATGQRDLADTFAGRPVRGEPYGFATAEWHADPGGPPRLRGAVATFDCVLEAARDFGSHTLFIGNVRAVDGRGGRPLLYTDRTYGHPARWT